MQFRYLGIRKDLFGEYYRDTSKITQANLLAFMKANMSYTMKNDFKKCQTKVRIVVGEKENKNMLRSAKILSKSLPNSILEIKSGLYHGAYSINRPEEYVNDLLHMAGQ